MDHPVVLSIVSGLFTTGLGSLIVMLIRLGGRVDMLVSSAKHTEATVDQLTIMCEHADDYGFGSRSTNELLKTQVGAIVALTKSVDALVQEIKLERELAKMSRSSERANN